MSIHALSNLKKRKRSSGSNRFDEAAIVESINFVLEQRDRANGPCRKLSQLLSGGLASRATVLVDPGKQIFNSQDSDLLRSRAWSHFQPLLTSSSAGYKLAQLPNDGSPSGIRVVFPVPMPSPCNISPLVGKRFATTRKSYSSGEKNNFVFFHHESTSVTILSHAYVPKCCCSGCDASIDLFLALFTFDALDDASCQDTIARIGARNSLHSFRAELTRFLGSGKVVVMPPMDSSVARRFPVSEFFIHVSRPHAPHCVPSAPAPWLEDTDHLRSTWLSSCSTVAPVAALNMSSWSNAAVIDTTQDYGLVFDAPSATGYSSQEFVLPQHVVAPMMPFLAGLLDEFSSETSAPSSPSSSVSAAEDHATTPFGSDPYSSDSSDELGFDAPSPKRLRLIEPAQDPIVALEQFGFFDATPMDNDLSLRVSSELSVPLSSSGLWSMPLSSSQLWSTDANFF
jgi:hypothetical protein